MEQAIELLDSVIDLQLGNANMDQWLQRLASQTGSSAAYAASWAAQETDSAEISFSHKRYTLDSKWLPAMGAIIAVAAPQTPDFLDDIARAAGLEIDAPDNPLNDPAWMIAFIDSYPACTILALRCPEKQASWRKADRALFKKALPVLGKAHQLHKHIVLSQNKLSIANQILDSAPRGLISMTPDGEILRINTMAADLLQRGDAFTEIKGHLICQDDKVMQQLNEKLVQIRALPLNSLREFTWNRTFQRLESTQNYQLSLGAYPLEGWRLESSLHDRFAVLSLYTTAFGTLPTADQLGDFYDLTNAQARVVIALMQGKSSAEAAAHLNVSLNTVRSHLRAVYKKLGTDNKADLIRVVSATLVGYSTTPF